jgi:hypothetical protein
MYNIYNVQNTEGAAELRTRLDGLDVSPIPTFDARNHIGYP